MGLAVLAILTGSLTLAAPANAASSPVAACGGGSYHVIDSHQIDGLATIYLLYNGRTNCVVTWKTAYIGTKTGVMAAVGIWGANDGRIDQDMYGYYAGPVKVDAPGKCIGWGGGAAKPGGWLVRWDSGKSHCG
ncbi:hypothetical protein [Nocardia cyriacigeorgica]|uniref:hypothetical protein n=1 Tax=Nocardia cyriacigeorgica TaxID=135487 RepID=UPI0021142B4F|nr:hypothetical protein [Nocardia cyriacigeorgica]